ncbi:hypothetical protein CMI37_36990 [Candidatus Pacearchaeota archaeon]|jgi:hypothetical protein|nr:hypothetical protein [Candidatus Pacearchaeota archaeon]
MAVEKTITFVEETELQQGYDTAEPKTVVNYWTEVDGRTVPGSFGTNETRAKAFYEKVCELNGETQSTKVLHTTTIHSKTNIKETVQ